MTTVKELRDLAQDYGLPGKSKLKKNDLIKAIAKCLCPRVYKKTHAGNSNGKVLCNSR